MSALAIRAALESRLNAIASPLPTQWENAEFDPPDGAYQRVDMLPGKPENPSIGGSHYRETGLFQVMLLYPIGVGSGAAVAKAEAIRTWFPRGATYVSGGVTVYIGGTAAIGPGRVDNDRYVLPVTIPYFANIVN